MTHFIRIILYLRIAARFLNRTVGSAAGIHLDEGTLAVLSGTVAQIPEVVECLCNRVIG
jgi:hypothetical protein